MAEILDRELKKLKKMVSTISMNVEESMNKAIGSFIKHDSKKVVNKYGEFVLYSAFGDEQKHENG